MTRTDFLRPLFSLPPMIVALVVWATGWGSLVLIAWRVGALSNGLLREPGHMVGDFLMLPLAGFFVARFYRSVAKPHPAAVRLRLTVLVLGIATVVTLLATLFSLFVSGNYQGLWSVPHTLFIWFIAYLLIGFFIRGALQLRSRATRSLYSMYAAVLLALTVHISLKLAFNVDLG